MRVFIQMTPMMIIPTPAMDLRCCEFIFALQ